MIASGWLDVCCSEFGFWAIVVFVALCVRVCSRSMRWFWVWYCGFALLGCLLVCVFVFLVIFCLFWCLAFSVSFVFCVYRFNNFGDVCGVFARQNSL